MSWSEYVKRIAGAADQAEIAKAAKVAGPTVSRWLSDAQGVKPEAAANFARYYQRPVLEAFVAAGFLTPAEAKVRPAAVPDYGQLSNDELLRLVRSRMREEVMGNAEHPAATSKAARRGGLTAAEREEAAAEGRRQRPVKSPVDTPDVDETA